jgi:hypothetical protein
MATTTGYIDYTEQAAPSSPASGHQRVYVDSTSHHWTRKNSSGTVTDMEAQAASSVTAHACRVHRASGNVSVGSNTLTVIGWDAEDYDTDTMHDTVTSNSRIVIPSISGVTTGLWSMTMKGYTDAPGASRSDVMFRKNAAGVNSGGTLIGITLGAHPDTGVGPVMGYEEWVLAAADYVEVFVRTTGGSGNLLFDSTTLPSFSMAFKGKVT